MNTTPVLKRIPKVLNSVLNIAMAVSLTLMSIFVFTNVVLRYVFGTGIAWSEEMSKFLFMYMVFLGAISALKDRTHLGIDILIKRLPAPLKRIVYIFTQLLILFVLGLVLKGSWGVTLSNIHTRSPVTDVPIAYIYAVGIILSIGMSMIVIFNIVRVLIDKESIHELARVAGEEVSEEIADNESIAPQSTGGDK